MSQYHTLKQHDHEGCRTLTINRPDKLNALNHQVVTELHQAFETVAAEESIRVVVLTGAGDKAFVAGADISEINTLNPMQAQQFARFGQQLMSRIEQLGKPVIARINGFALGGGCELAMACTLRVASSNARMGLPEISLGIMPGFGGTQRMARLIGQGQALELALTGRQVKASEAQQLGLLSQVCEPEQLDAITDELASKLARSAPVAMRNIIAAVQAAGDVPLHSGLDYEAQLFGLCCATEDMREGTSAFLEKRPAEFHGH